MEEKTRSVFGTLVLIISDIAIIDMIYMVLGANYYSAVTGISFLPGITVTVLTFMLYHLFLRSERTLPQAVTFLVVSYFVTVVILLVFFMHPPNIILTVLAIMFWCIPFWRIYFLTETPPTLDKFIARFGSITFSLLFVLVFVVETGAPYTRILPCAISLFLCLAALIAVRTAGSGADSSRGIRGVAVILAFLLLIGSIIAVFLLFAAASFGMTIAAGAAALWHGIKYAGNMLLEFLIWLNSFLPELGEGRAPESEPMPFLGEISDWGSPFVFLGATAFLIILCVIAALTAAVVAFLVIRFRGKKLGGRRMKKASAISRFKLRMRPEVTKRFFNAVRFFIDSILFRNTPQGVFLRIERWGRLRRRGRAPGETPRNYLKRISYDVPQHKEALTKLADALDAHWYGDSAISQMPLDELTAIRRAFSSAI
jgi:hypothetical protein